VCLRLGLHVEMVNLENDFTSGSIGKALKFPTAGQSNPIKYKVSLSPPANLTESHLLFMMFVSRLFILKSIHRQSLLMEHSQCQWSIHNDRAC
jgi:hypothetical protein